MISPPKSSTPSQIHDAAICDKWDEMMNEFKTAKSRTAARATVPFNDPVVLTTHQSNTPILPQIDTTPKPQSPSPVDPTQLLSNSMVKDISTTVILPPIHPGMYPTSHSPTSTTHTRKHATPSPPKPNPIHKEFRQLNDLIDYEELYHTVEAQLNRIDYIQLDLLDTRGHHLLTNFHHYHLTEHTCYQVIAVISLSIKTILQ